MQKSEKLGMARRMRMRTLIILVGAVFLASSLRLSATEDEKLYRLDYNEKTKTIEYVLVTKIDMPNRVYRKKSVEWGYQDFISGEDLALGWPVPRFFLTNSKVNLKHFGGPANMTGSLMKDGKWRLIEKKMPQKYRMHQDEPGGKDEVLEPAEDLDEISMVPGEKRQHGLVPSGHSIDSPRPTTF